MSTHDPSRDADPTSPASAHARIQARTDARSQIGHYLRGLAAAIGLLPDAKTSPDQAAVEKVLAYLYELNGSGSARFEQPDDLPNSRAVTDWFAGRTVPNTVREQNALLTLASQLAELVKKRGSNIPEPNGNLTKTLNQGTTRLRNPRPTPTAAPDAQVPTGPDPAPDAADGLLRLLMKQPLEIEPPLGPVRARAPRSRVVSGVRGAGPVVVGDIPLEPVGFVPRDVVQQLGITLQSGRAALTGQRGVGKSQVAAAYARQRITDGWSLVAWVNADAPEQMLAELAAIAKEVGVEDPEGDSTVSAQRLKRHLETSTLPGVLVFDNASNPDRLRMHLPTAGATQVVITSTDLAFANLGRRVDVPLFTPDESVRFLTEQTGIDDDQGAN